MLARRSVWGDYIALGYVWGNSLIREWITVNGYKVPITHNLYRLLLLGREIYPPDLGIWTDAICINQNDLEERAREVQKMSMIYTRASSVHAWIGEASTAHDSVENFRVLQS